jgi:hypothetical protein
MSNQGPTPYGELNEVLAELARGFVGAYLQGSFAVGDYDEHSDVDFLVAVAADPTPEEAAALQALHERLYAMATPWARHLEGSYFPAADLRRLAPGSGPLLYIDNGSRALERSQHDNTLVVRWVTREHGITLAGPPPATLIDPVPPEALRAEIRAVMRDWGAEILMGKYRLDNRWAQPFVVLSYCRMLHSLETGTVESKPAGARWAEARLDPAWAGLIRRAWAERPDPGTKYRQPADPAEVEATYAFIRYALGRAGS